MAIQFSALGAGLERNTGAFLSGNANFTIMFWVFSNTDFAPLPDYRAYQVLANGVYDKYIGLYGASDSNQVAITYDNGGGPINTDLAPYILDDAYHICYVYDNTAKTLKFYVNKSLIDTLTSVDLSAVVFAQELLGYDGFTLPGLVLQNYRSWQRALTTAQIIAEAASNEAVLATNLFCDTPLTDASDLADVSGNARNWSAVGVPVDYITHDLKFIGAVPPVNISGITAIDIPLDNYHTIQKVDNLGTTYTVWYKFTALIDDVLAIWAYGDDTTYKAFIDIYGPNSDAISYGGITQNKPGQLIVRAGETWYFRIVSNAGNPTPASLTFSVFPSPALALTTGDVFVNNDTAGLPAIIFDGLTGEIKQIKINFPAGEAGDSILSPTPFYAVTASSPYAVKVFDQLFVELNSFTPTGYHGQESLIRGNKTLGFIYVLTHDVSNNWALESIDNTGAVALVETLTLGLLWAQVKAFALNNPGDRVYFANGNIIQIWSLTTHALLPNFATGPTSHSAYDILVQSNDHVLVLWIRTTTGSIQVIEYDTAGAVLFTNDFGTDNVHTLFHHIAYSLNDPTRYWLWSHPRTVSDSNLNLSRFREVTTATGVAAVDFEAVEFESDIYGPDVTPTPLARFGPSFSCPFFLVADTAGVGASIIVNKVKVGGPDDSFDFTTTGGLSPSTFSLEDEGNQTFSGLTAGTYGITETAKTGYSASYAVSNGDDPDAITVADGDVVTVTVTNTYEGVNPLSGIYQIVPDKRNDTLWTSFDPEETEDVKIPDPFFKSALFGK